MNKLKQYGRRYFIDAMGAMAQGLFATLLMGTILKTVGTYLGADYIAVGWINTVGGFLLDVAGYATAATGAAIGAAVAWSMKSHPLVIFSCAVVGMAGYACGTQITEGISYTAGPAGAYVAAVVAAEVGMLVSKKTKVDILVTPAVTLLSGVLVAKLVGPGIAWLMYWLGNFVNTATEYQPLLMGVVVAVVVGMILTLPISSAAICAMIGITGIAGGAAAVGCCCQMVGFAVISFRENRWGGVVAQGLGTSMLQMGNICRKPQIWIAPTLAAAVCGPLSTLVFKLKCTGAAAGMGTCGLVGPLGILADGDKSPMMWIGLLLLCVVLPAALSLGFNEILRAVGWVKTGDMKIEA